MTHGSCNFNPPKDLEHVQALLEKKRRDRADAEGLTGDLQDAASLSDLGQITETELREVEREAEKRYKPFACGVGDCQRRYKNMNGLRYHYQHSGEHGVIGLGLLATGVHECLNHGSTGSSSREHSVSREGRKSRGHSKPSSRAPSTSRTGTPVPGISVPSLVQAQTLASSQQQQQPPSPTRYTSSLAQALTFPTPPSSATTTAKPYQKQFAEHQRAQYVQQQTQAVDSQQQLQQLQAQIVAMQNRMYSGSSLDGAVSG